MNVTNNPANRQHGVTLVELMIVVVIIGILGAIAYPSYRNQVMRSARTEARVALEQRALALEKCFTRFLNYNNPLCAATLVATDRTTEGGRYTITISPPANNETQFTLTATAQGGQVRDTACPTLTLNDRGQRGPAGCW